jgi:hypothetical protein
MPVIQAYVKRQVEGAPFEKISPPPAAVAAEQKSRADTALIDQRSSAVTAPAPAATVNVLARAFEAGNRRETAGDFIRAEGNMHLEEICAAFNKHGQYGQLLQLFGVHPDAEVMRFLALLRERYLAGQLSGDCGNPTKELLKHLCASRDFAAMPLDAFAATLMKCNSAAVQAVVANWIGAMADQKQKEQNKIRVAVDAHEELRSFFLAEKLATDEAEAQQFIDRLTAPNVDVHTLEHLRLLDASDLSKAGFSLRHSKQITAALKPQ